jgi:hypothetical protein
VRASAARSPTSLQQQVDNPSVEVVIHGAQAVRRFGPLLTSEEPVFPFGTAKVMHFDGEDATRF